LQRRVECCPCLFETRRGQIWEPDWECGLESCRARFGTSQSWEYLMSQYTHTRPSDLLMHAGWGGWSVWWPLVRWLMLCNHTYSVEFPANTSRAPGIPVLPATPPTCQPPTRHASTGGFSPGFHGKAAVPGGCYPNHAQLGHLPSPPVPQSSSPTACKPMERHSPWLCAQLEVEAALKY
jgi:hypothetical protein